MTANTTTYTDNISDALGISDVGLYTPSNERLPVIIEQPPEGMTDADVDFNKVRSSTYELIDGATQAFRELLDISTRSQDHESYASLAALVKTVAGLNKDLIAMHEKKNKPLNGGGADETSVTNNNLILTTAQLQELLDRNNK